MFKKRTVKVSLAILAPIKKTEIDSESHMWQSYLKLLQHPKNISFCERDLLLNYAVLSAACGSRLRGVKSTDVC